MPSAASVVFAQGLGLRWPGGEMALEGVSLEIEKGEKVALLGPNGAGKSTFLRLLAGRLLASAGELRIFGRPAAALPRQWLAYLPQELTLDPEMKAGESLALIAALLGLADAKAAVARAAALFRLGPHLGKPVAELSGGWRRRLDLAVFLLEERELLLLDEPGSGLDAEGEELLFAALEERSARGATILLVGHDVERLSRFTRRGLLFERGRLVAEGEPESFAAATTQPWAGQATGRTDDGGRMAAGRAGRGRRSDSGGRT